jgi:hypothetical protein
MTIAADRIIIRKSGYAQRRRTGSMHRPPRHVKIAPPFARRPTPGAFMLRHLLRALCACSLALLLAGCEPLPDGDTASDWLVHNPTAEAVRVRIDGQAIEVAPGKSHAITLQAGKHTLDTAATGPLEFMTYLDAKGGVINPTLSTYVVVSIAFQREGGDGRFDARGSERQVITLDGVSFKGAFRTERALFIEKDWAYGVGEPVPETIGTDSQLPGGFLNKLYSKEEFFAEAGARPESVDPAPRWEHPALPLVPAFENASIEQAAKPYREAQRSLYLSTDPVEHGELRKTLSTLIGPILDAGKAAGDTLSAQDTAAFDVVAQQLKHPMPGALVLPKAE